MSASAPEIRPAGPQDRDAVLALLVAQLREHDIDTPVPEVAHAVDGMLRHPGRGRILVALVDGSPIGVAVLSSVWTLEHGGRAMWLDELYVEPDRRGQGIGRQLLAAALQTAAGIGAIAVDLEVETSHARAARLYAREGFQRHDRTRWVRKLEHGVPPSPAAVALPLVGGCFCGAVRYAVARPPREVTHCHCGICRRTTGAPFVTWATFPAAAFALSTGTPSEIRATPRAVRSFCSRCGTALTFRETARPNSVDVTVGSFDAPDALAPEEHIWTTSRLAWLHVDDDLAEHPEEKPGETDCEP
jgi:GNAT superfamily N-acetyltransferase